MLDKIATVEVSAVCFSVGFAEFSWTDLKTGETAILTTEVPKKFAKEIGRIVTPCSYHRACVNFDNMDGLNV